MLAVPKRDIIGHHSVGPLDRKLEEKKKKSENNPDLSGLCCGN